jgi:VWA domain-containing protein
VEAEARISEEHDGRYVEAAAVSGWAELGARLRGDLATWRNLRIDDLLFADRDTAIGVLLFMTGASLALLLWRGTSRRPRRNQVALPAIVIAPAASPLSVLRHGAWVLFLSGLPFFALALAGPYTAFGEQAVSYPGRRIALMIDASSSTMAPFEATRLIVPNAPNRSVFFTTVAATEAFIRQRMEGKYRDLIALIEFGDQSYVITPFTNDYSNVLLSTSLIGEWAEFEKFPDHGTTIGNAIEEAINLFKAFDYLDAAGNAMVIFSDGQDMQVTAGGKTVDEVLAEALAARIPVYFIRCGLNRRLGDIIPDATWRPAVESTGGRFYAAANEQDVLDAIRDIDRRSLGKVDMKRYTVQQPRFEPFALIASGLWVFALALKVTVPYFSTFP